MAQHQQQHILGCGWWFGATPVACLLLLFLGLLFGGGAMVCAGNVTTIAGTGDHDAGTSDFGQLPPGVAVDPMEG